MLAAIAEHFSSENAYSQPVQLTVERWFGTYAERTRYGLLHKVSSTRFGRSAAAIRLMPRSFRNAYGLVREDDIDAVLDASGFAFGDQHGPGPTERMARSVRRWKRQGKRVVLLSQAFGPFTSARIRAAMRAIVDQADLVCARDAGSHEHLCELTGGASVVRLAPDFTNLVDGRLPLGFVPETRQVMIVPNQRMVDKTTATEGAEYVPFLVRCVEAARRCDGNPCLLVHDSGDDCHLAEQVQNVAGKTIPVIRESDPRCLKGILGTAVLVVGSRFHALVSALSQGVPCLAAGWSHKYAALLEDYWCRDCLLTAASTSEEIERAMAPLVVENTRAQATATLARAVALQRTLAQTMWTEVDSVLGLN